MDLNNNNNSSQSISKSLKALSDKQKSSSSLYDFLWIPPLIMAILVPVVCIGSYLYAIYTHQMVVILPYLSDVGSHSPQAAYFSQIFDIIGLLFIITAYCRYKQIAHYLNLHRLKSQSSNSNQLDHLAFINRLAPIFILIALFGELTLANFRFSEFFYFHLVGVFTLFPAIYIYALLMVYLSSQLNSHLSIESPPISMAIFTALGILSLLAAATFSAISLYTVGIDAISSTTFRANWNCHVTGHLVHVLASLCEWITVHLYVGIFLSLSQRMRLFCDWEKVLQGVY